MSAAGRWSSFFPQVLGEELRMASELSGGSPSHDTAVEGTPRKARAGRANGQGVEDEAFTIDAVSRHREGAPKLPKLMAARADVEITIMIVDEVGTAESAVPALGFSKHGPSGSIPRSCTSQAGFSAEP